MESRSVITVIKEYKGLFSSAAISLIIHTLIFLFNPTFSFITIDKLEDSKGQFLTVELISEEEPAPEIAESPGVRERIREEEKVKNKKIDSVPAAKSKPKVRAEAPRRRLASEDKNVAGPTVPAQDQVAVQQEQKVAARDLPSPEREASKPEMSEEVKEVPVRLPEADHVQPTESIEQEVEQGPVSDSPVEKEMVDQLPVSGEKEVDVIPEPEVKKEGPVAEPEPMIPTPEQPEPVADVTDVREAELKTEVQKQDLVSEESPEDKEVKVVKEATDKVEPVPADIVPPELPAEKKKESVNDVEQKVETEEKRDYVPDKRAEEMKVAEEREEPKPPVKKKKRIIPFRKIVESERDSEIGIPMGRPFVKFTAPAKKVSSRVQSLSGRAQGKGVTRVTLSVNGGNTTVPVQNGHFLWDTVLRDGKNTISGTVWDTDGKSASDTVTVEVLPSKNGFKLSIDEPAGELESPVATVRGRVEDATVDTVRLILNGEFLEIPVEDGYFEKTVLFKERENALQAEATNSAGLTVRTEPLKVQVKSPLVADILIHLVWEDTEVEPHPGLSMKERSHLEDERAARKEVNIVELISAAEGYGEMIFSVGKAGDGAYTLKVTGGRGTDLKLVASLNSSQRRVRVFKKRLLEGEEWIVGRFLMPEGVFWDEDELFSGRIEGSDSMIKYKSPEGVTWKEPKEGP